MKKTIYNKLVRDNIPALIQRRGAIPKVLNLNRSRYREELKKKLIEETRELSKTRSKRELLDELADLSQLIDSIAESHGIALRAVEIQKDNKKEERGGFEKKLFLKYVEEP